MSYAQQSDVEAVFGPGDVAAWSRFDPAGPTGAADAGRVAAALAYADGEVDAFFAGGPYALPLAVTTDGPTVAYWAGVIAGVWLYGSRAGVSYVDYAGNRFLALKASVYADMHQYKAGVKRLTAAARFPHPTGPVGGRTDP